MKKHLGYFFLGVGKLLVYAMVVLVFAAIGLLITYYPAILVLPGLVLIYFLGMPDELQEKLKELKKQEEEI